MEYLAVIIGAIAYRIRGGAFNETMREYLGKPEGWEIPNGYIRWTYGVVMGLLVTAAHGEAWLLLTIPLWFLGTTAGYFGGFFNLEDPSKRNPKNYARLAARGGFIALPYAVFASFFVETAFLPVILGMMLPIAYLVAIPMQYVVKRRWGFSQIGEAIIGGLVALGAVYG